MKKFYYNEVYWAYIAVNIFLSFLVTTLNTYEWIVAISVLLLLYTFYMIFVTHKALQEAGWTFGWLFALLLFIPFGMWLVFFVVRWKLKPLKKWSRKD